MGALFFDTSALLKRYIQTEPGSTRVLDLCDPQSGNALYLSALTSIEVASALNQRVRERRMRPSQRDNRWRIFRRDLDIQYQVIAWDDAIRQTAEHLVFAHPLRGYDAVHIAAALRLSQMLAGLSAEIVFCTGDQRQARAAQAEGLAAEFIGSVSGRSSN